MKDEAKLMLERATEFLESAVADRNVDPPRLNVAFADAVTAAELAGKAMLLQTTGTYPKRHEIGGALYHADLVPGGIDPSRLDQFFRQHTRGRYGFLDQITRDEVDDAIALAENVLEEARGHLG